MENKLQTLIHDLTGLRVRPREQKVMLNFDSSLAKNPFVRLPNVKSFWLTTNVRDPLLNLLGLPHGFNPDVKIERLSHRIRAANRYVDVQYAVLIKFLENGRIEDFWIRACQLMLRSKVLRAVALRKLDNNWFRLLKVGHVKKLLSQLVEKFTTLDPRIFLARFYVDKQKPDGTMTYRPVGSPAYVDRAYMYLLQCFFVIYLSGYIGQYQHAYRPGKGVLTAWKSVKEYIDMPHIYEFDLKGAFPSVNTSFISHELGKLGVPGPIVELIRAMALAYPEVRTLDTSKLPEHDELYKAELDEIGLLHNNPKVETPLLTENFAKQREDGSAEYTGNVLAPIMSFMQKSWIVTQPVTCNNPVNAYFDINSEHEVVHFRRMTQAFQVDPYDVMMECKLDLTGSPEAIPGHVIVHRLILEDLGPDWGYSSLEDITSDYLNALYNHYQVEAALFEQFAPKAEDVPDMLLRIPSPEEFHLPSFTEMLNSIKAEYDPLKGLYANYIKALEVLEENKKYYVELVDAYRELYAQYHGKDVPVGDERRRMDKRFIELAMIQQERELTNFELVEQWKMVLKLEKIDQAGQVAIKKKADRLFAEAKELEVLIGPAMGQRNVEEWLRLMTEKSKEIHEAMKGDFSVEIPKGDPSSVTEPGFQAIPLPMTRGFPQGGGLSPILFAFAFEHVLYREYLVKVLKDTGWKIVAYADDFVIFLEKVLDEAKMFAGSKVLTASGLTFNRAKSGWVKKDGKWLKPLKFLGKTYDGNTGELTGTPRSGIDTLYEESDALSKFKIRDEGIKKVLKFCGYKGVGCQEVLDGWGMGTMPWAMLSPRLISEAVHMTKDEMTQFRDIANLYKSREEIDPSDLKAVEDYERKVDKGATQQFLNFISANPEAIPIPEGKTLAQMVSEEIGGVRTGLESEPIGEDKFKQDLDKFKANLPGGYKPAGGPTSRRNKGPGSKPGKRAEEWALAKGTTAAFAWLDTRVAGWVQNRLFSGGFVPAEHLDDPNRKLESLPKAEGRSWLDFQHIGSPLRSEKYYDLNIFNASSYATMDVLNYLTGDSSWKICKQGLRNGTRGRG